MRITRLAPALALVGICLTASLASAASTPKPPGSVTVTDQGGDGNGINSQGDLAPIPATKTPGQVAGADILSITYGSTFTTAKVKGKTVYTVTGLKVVMTLAGPPQGNVIFRATPEVGECTTFDLSFQLYAGGKNSSWLRDNCPGFAKDLPTDTYEDVPLDSATASGNTITWLMRKGKSLPASIKPGAVFENLSGHTRFVIGANGVGVATAPVLDEITGDAIYKYGK